MKLYERNEYKPGALFVRSGCTQSDALLHRFTGHKLFALNDLFVFYETFIPAMNAWVDAGAARRVTACAHPTNEQLEFRRRYFGFGVDHNE